MSPYCPNCAAAVDAAASKCERCGADFTDPKGWRPTAAPETSKPKAVGPAARQCLLRLIVGGIALGAYHRSAQFLAYFDVGTGPLLTWPVVGVVLLYWAARPVIRLLTE